MEKAQHGWVRRRPSDEDRLQRTAERIMNGTQETPAKAGVRATAGERVECGARERERRTPRKRERGDARANPHLQILQNGGNESDVSNAMLDERIAHQLGTKSTQVHHHRAAEIRTEKSNHEVDGVVRRKNAEIANARRKGMQREKRLQLLQVIPVREDASLGTPSRSRRVHDARGIPTFAGHERRSS